MKSIRIPRFFHEVFGKESTILELTLTLAFATLSTILILIKSYSELQSFELFQIVVVLIIAFDISGGVIANFTFSTNNQYKKSMRARLIFITAHIQPLILALVLGEYYLPCALIWGYTIISAFIVNGFAKHPAQRTIGAVLMVFGILWLSLFFYDLPRYLLVILIFYLVKVSFSFAVDHYALREKLIYRTNYDDRENFCYN